MKHYRSEVWEMVLIGFHQSNLSLSMFMLNPARFKHINLLLIVVSIVDPLTCETGEIISDLLLGVLLKHERRGALGALVTDISKTIQAYLIYKNQHKNLLLFLNNMPY